jgi:hypothetical protein
MMSRTWSSSPIFPSRSQVGIWVKNRKVRPSSEYIPRYRICSVEAGDVSSDSEVVTTRIEGQYTLQAQA